MSFTIGTEVIGTDLDDDLEGHRGAVIGKGTADDNVMVRFRTPAFNPCLKRISGGDPNYDEGDVVDKYTGLVWIGYLMHIPALQLLAESAE